MTEPQPNRVSGTFYVTLEPEWSNWYKDEDGNYLLVGAKAVKVTQKKPNTVPQSGAVVTKMTLDLPASAFLPLMPVAEVRVEPGQTETVVVEMGDPS